jgi:hypothetical protein
VSGPPPLRNSAPEQGFRSRCNAGKGCAGERPGSGISSTGQVFTGFREAEAMRRPDKSFPAPPPDKSFAAALR